MNEGGDLLRTCRICFVPFMVTALEQDALKQHFGASYRPPATCLACRRAKRAQREAELRASFLVGPSQTRQDDEAAS